MATFKTNDKTFSKDVLKSDKPVLVDFWAEWCGPCKSIAPTLEEISDELESLIKVAKVNVDENPNLAQQFNIRSIPALMIFKKGNLVGEMMGAVQKSSLEEWVKKTLN